MKTLKTLMALAIILLMAVHPGNWALWAVAVGTCMAIYYVADRKENGVQQCDNTTERRAVKNDTPDCPHYNTGGQK